MATEKRLIDAYGLESYLWVLFKFFGSLPCSEEDKVTQYTIKRCIGEVKKMPTVDAVEVVHGRWREKILVGGFAEEWSYVCSECGCTVSDRSKLGIGKYASNNQRLNYCPNCGADMRDGDGNG